MLFANLKKCRFYQDEVCFLGYHVLAHGMRIENKQSEIVRNWPKSKLV